MDREAVALEYLDHLLHPPYPVQEEAILAWASCDGGILLSAPTGTGKTLVAEAAVFEGLKSGKRVYYSTPLIALTDQKLLELQETVARWGYPRESVGLVTGHRTINGDAPILVVVAEVLLNRLLHPEAFDFANVGSVVMDEFHHFNEPERGIVWELSLTLLPKHVRVMLLSATVGSADSFVNWIARALDRSVTLVESHDRKVPLAFEWVADELLPDFVERIARGVESARRTPAIIFAFDRAICWEIAEVLKGRDLFVEGQRQALLDRLEAFDFKVGAGNKLRTFLARGIGLHHAGLLPRYRRIVETLFQEKLLPICVATETLAAGINLPARSVMLTTLVKGPRDRKKLIDVGNARQMFGRAGRPQFDSQGFVYALAHEDDVKIAKWQEKYDQIPETEKDPKLMAAKKALLKKKPTRRTNVTYWNAEQFVKLQTAPSAKLASRGRLTWRWLAFLLDANPSVEPIRQVIRQRLMESGEIDAELKRLDRMLVTLHRMNVVTLEPEPPPSWLEQQQSKPAAPEAKEEEEDDAPTGTIGLLLAHLAPQAKLVTKTAAIEPTRVAYTADRAVPTPRLKQLTTFRAVHPLYGLWLLDHLGQADRNELIQILESLLEMPGTVARSCRVPWPQDMPPGPLATQAVDPLLYTRGLATPDDLYPDPDQTDVPPELRKYPVPLAEKLRLLFESEIDHAGGLHVTPVWAIGDLLERGGDFDAYVRTRDLVKQEGILFKHAMRMILLCGEFMQMTPTNAVPEAWRETLRSIADTLTAACRAIDPQSTDEQLEELEDDSA